MLIGQFKKKDQKKIEAAAQELENLIATTPDEEWDEHSNYVAKGRPVSVDVDLDEKGNIEDIEVIVGHHDGYWFNLDGDEDHAQLLDFIVIAAGNERENNGF